MYFRIFIHKDPEAANRGFSLQGIRVPLTTYCPVKATPELLGLDGSSIFLKTTYMEFWEIPCSLLVMANPTLLKHLRYLDYLLVPTDWCDIAPICD